MWEEAHARVCVYELIERVFLSIYTTTRKERISRIRFKIVERNYSGCFTNARAPVVNKINL